MKKKYVSRLLAGCLTVTMLTPTGALASVPQPVVTQEASQVAGQENETENKEQAEEYAAEGAAEVQTDKTEAAENRTAADKSREQTEPQTAQTVLDGQIIHQRQRIIVLGIFKDQRQNPTVDQVRLVDSGKTLGQNRLDA